MNDISNKINELLLNVVLPLFVVYMKSMDTNSWQLSFDNRHFAQFVPNLFGKLNQEVSQIFFFDYVLRTKIIRRKNLLIFPGVYFVHKGINVKVGYCVHIASYVYLSFPDLYIAFVLFCSVVFLEPKILLIFLFFCFASFV